MSKHNKNNLRNVKICLKLLYSNSAKDFVAFGPKSSVFLIFNLEQINAAFENSAFFTLNSEMNSEIIGYGNGFVNMGIFNIDKFYFIYHI